MHFEDLPKWKQTAILEEFNHPYTIGDITLYPDPTWIDWRAPSIFEKIKHWLSEAT